LSENLLSDITVFNKYSRYLPIIKRRETWEELCIRNAGMHIRKYPRLSTEIIKVYKEHVIPKKILPSMRSLQFAGRPIELSNSRIFNCAYLPLDHPDAFSELMFLLLGGTGCGYSVQKMHIEKLPKVIGVSEDKRKFLIGDSIEGWSDTIKVLVEAYFYGKAKPCFVYNDIRPKGATLVTSGGKAPGPEPLKHCVEKLEEILIKASGRKLETIEAHDMACIIADAVLAGGIRRAALISLFSHDDIDLLLAKSGDWWMDHPYRGRANNSAVFKRKEITRKDFFKTWTMIEDSNCGEPGIYWTNDEEIGTNPCAEISLLRSQFCNLVDVNVSNIVSQEDLNERCKAAAFIATLQAGYTDFHYLRPIWKENTEKDALIGVGMTGIGSDTISSYNLEESAIAVKEENKRVAELIGINPAARCTTVKPAGTSSLVLGCSSGIHAWHNDYYIRRIRIGKNEALYKYLIEELPELVEDDVFNPNGAVMSFPQKAPEGSKLRSERAIALLERVKKFNLEWVRNGHREGKNYNNVSTTVSLKENEWEEVGRWMWDNRDTYNGITVLPYDGGTYQQAPFEDCTEEVYEEMCKHFHSIDLTKVKEEDDVTNLSAEIACGGNGCEVI
jgi:ribonucleoside-diphosphate reductase alpha chain